MDPPITTKKYEIDRDVLELLRARGLMDARTIGYTARYTTGNINTVLARLIASGQIARHYGDDGIERYALTGEGENENE